MKVHYVDYSKNYDIIVNRGPFNAVHFNGGLKLLGTPSKKVQGIQEHYTIMHMHY